MAGRNIAAVEATVTAATATGYLTVTSAVGLYVGAKGWLSAGSRIQLDYNTKTAGWNIGETVTGETSAATGVISAVVGGAPGGASGSIVLTGVVGTFSAAEVLDGSVSGVASAIATAAQYTVPATQDQVEITSIASTTIGVRIIPVPTNGSAPNYGRSDVSAYTLGGKLDQEDQFIYNRNDAPAP